MISTQIAIATSQKAKRRTALLVCLCATLAGCGLNSSSEYVVRVDSVAVAPPAQANGAVKATYFGVIGGNSCATLVRIEREQLLADTLRVRFIGRQDNGNCLQSPYLLKYVDSIPNTPPRTVHLLVQQPGDSPLRYDVTLPLPPAR